MDKSQNTAKNRPVKPEDPRRTDRVERIIVGIVLFVLTVVPLLTFLFSFGNVGDLGTSLGIDRRIAYLTGPAVDLTVTGMIVAATWLSHRGRTEKELWPIHTLSIICALIMFGLNCGPAIYAHRYQLAGFSAVGPFLLMAMGFVGPWLLRQITDAQTPAARSVKPAPARNAAAAPAERTGPAPARLAGTAPGTTPAPVPNAPERLDSGTGTTAAASAGTRTSFEVWVERAVPLFEAYVEKHSEHPTAAVLAGRLRTTVSDPDMPGSDRWERKLKSAVKDRLGLSEDETESTGAAGR